MRKATFVLAVTACAASSLSLAQQRDPPVDIASPAAVATASAGSQDNGTDREKSGFGQVMSVLTGLLQDAAGKESVGAPSAASRILSSEESAVTVRVTPVAGRSTFFVDKPAVPAVGKPRPGPHSATPSTQVAVAAIDAEAAQAAQVAMQAEGELPD